MILFALAILLILIFFYNSKIFIYALMVFFVLFDMFDGFYKDEKIFAAIRYVVPLLFVSFFIVRESVLKRKDLIFIVVSLYLIVLLVYSPGDFIISAKNLAALLLALLMIPVGRYLGRHYNFLDEFEGFNRFLLVILPVYIVLANIFNIGESYSDAFTTGFLITSRMYIVPIVVFLAIHYLVSNKVKSRIVKGIDLVFILINIFIIIINTRRTALGMLAGALLVYAILNRRLIFKMAVLSVFCISALVLTYPFYEKILVAQLEKRERIKDIETYDEEGRILEALYIFDHHTRRQNIFEILFGVKLFDTYDFGVRYFGRDRPIHSDINMVFYSTGITGTFLFAVLILHYFLLGNHRISMENRKIYYPLLIMFLIVLLPGRFIGTLTYAPFLMLLLSGVKALRSEPVVNSGPAAIKYPRFAINENSNRRQML
ncbi:MAG: hypothetical protein WD824_09610 [Cyclobacteriaceae bacterium]